VLIFFSTAFLPLMKTGPPSSTWISLPPAQVALMRGKAAVAGAAAAATSRPATNRRPFMLRSSI